MKVKTEPMLGAAMFAIAVLVVGNLFYLILTYQGMQAMMNSPLFDLEYMQSLEQGTLTPEEEAAFNSNFEESFTSAWSFSGIGGLLSCLSWLVAGIGAGVIYPILYKRSEPEVVGAVSGGAVSAALGNVIGYLFVTIVSTILILPLMNDWMNQMMAFSAPPGAAAPTSFGGVFVTWIVIGTVCGTLMMAGIGAALGAIGGLIGDAVSK